MASPKAQEKPKPTTEKPAPKVVTKRKRAVNDEPESAKKKSRAAKIEAGDVVTPARAAKVVEWKTEALKSRVHADIYIANPSPYNNQAVLAAYLRLPDTSALLAMIESPNHQPAFAVFEAERCKNFSVVTTKLGQKGDVGKKNLFETWIANPDSISEETLGSSLPLSLSAFPIARKEERKNVSWAIGMYKVIKEFPASFSTEGDAKAQGVLGNITPENWNRAYELLRFYHRQQGAGAAPHKELRVNKAAEAPVFLTAADIKGLVEDDKNGSAAPPDPLLEVQARDLYESDVEDLDEEARAKRAEDIEDTISNLTWKPPKPGASRPPISTSEQRVICHTLASKVVQMYPDQSVDLCPEDDPAAGWDGLDATLKENIDRAPVAEVVAETIKKGVNDNDAKRKSDQVEQERQRVKAFWAMQASMNSVSCAAPPYEEACQILGLHPEYPALYEGGPFDWQSDESIARLESEAQDAYRRQEKSTTRLYPWQVIGAAWLCLIERSGRPTCVLGDDMGLGKTITTIAFLLLSDPQTVPVPSSTAVDRPGSIATSTAVDTQPPPPLSHDAPPSPSGTATAADLPAPPPPSTPLSVPIPKIDHLQNRRYKPTLLLFPSSAADVWRDEYRGHFSSVKSVHSWFGSPNSGRMRDRDITLNTSPQALVDFITDLGDVPSTAGHVIMTSLHTLRNRSLYVKTALAQSAEQTIRTAKARVEAKKKARARSQNASSSLPTGDDDDDDDDFEGADTEEVNEEELSQYASYLPGIFDRVCVDEAHLLKTRNTYLNLAVSLLVARCVILITGTPMINKAADYEGLLHLLYRPELNEEDLEPDIADFEAFAGWDERRLQKGKGTSTAVEFPAFQHLLRPDSFRKLMRPQAGEPLDPITAFKIMRPILRMVQLRRVMASEVEANGKTVRVGEEIPPYRITTVELQHLKAQSRAYFEIHNVEAKAMGLGRDEKTQETKINFAKHRNLCHATLNPQLFRLAHNKIENVNRWYSEYDDYGATILHQAARPAPWLPLYGLRRDMAAFMAGQSAKLSWLAGYVHHVVRDRQRKLLIFCAFPLTLLNVLAFLSNLGFSCLSIRSADPFNDRATTAANFNDPHHSSEILITTLQVGGASLNLHHACADCLFVDVPNSANAMLQALHRIFRLGQKLTGNIILLTLNHSYDQALQAKACRKMIAQIAGQSDVEVTTAMRNDYKAKHDNWDEEGAREDLLTSQILLEQCLELYQRTCGQRSSRHEWVDAYDITAKDRLITVEKDFRVSLGLKPLEVPKGFQPLPGDEKCLLQRIRDRGKDRSFMDDSADALDIDSSDTTSIPNASSSSEPKKSDTDDDHGSSKPFFHPSQADSDDSSELSNHPSLDDLDHNGLGDLKTVDVDMKDDPPTPRWGSPALGESEGLEHPLIDPDLTRRPTAGSEDTHMASRAGSTAPENLAAQREPRRSLRPRATKS